MDGKVVVELDVNEALLLQMLLNTVALHRDTEKDKVVDEKKKNSFPADVMKISLKVTTGILQSFMEENN